MTFFVVLAGPKLSLVAIPYRKREDAEQWELLNDIEIVEVDAKTKREARRLGRRVAKTRDRLAAS